MIKKYIAMGLALAIFGAATPVFAGDNAVPNLFPRRAALPEWAAVSFDARGALPHGVVPAAGLALAPRLARPSPQGQQAAQPATPARARSGNSTLKWVGVALMVGGGALIARGASLSDPCSGFNSIPGVLCSSNYTTVRAASFGLGGGLAVGGLVLVLKNR